MTNTQLNILRSIIQGEIYLIVEAQKVERSFKVEEQRLNDLWQDFKDSFDG
tara:strand:- start:2662 stop:2814 length:153 start_codon:yes stop_codon:yes gene_type:complete